MRMRNALQVLILFLASGGGLGAQEANRPQVMRISHELHQAFAQKDYATAEAKCRELLALAPDEPNGHYNLACALARQAKPDAALEALGAAVAKGYNDPAHLKADEDLASLRELQGFKDLAAKARENEQKGNYEKGSEIPGLKSIEDFPEGGLRYRLRLSAEATKEKPQRLMLWLHPSGGSMNQVAENMAPLLAKHGCALAVFTQKAWGGWSSEDAAKLAPTLEALGKVEGLDASKPILFGYSAGGQMALTLWAESPGRYGGLVIDAAYPLDTNAYARGQVQAMALPQDEAIKKVPIFSLVGEADGGHQLWTQIKPKWLEAGIPLVYRTVPGKGHTWLFGVEQRTALAAWLDSVNSGKFPSDPLAAPEPEAAK